MTAVKEAPPSCPTLRAATAAELMCPELVSVREDAFVPEAVALLTRKGFHAAPVIDDAGRPVGVLSFTDLLVHEHNRKATTTASAGARVRDLMTPAVFSVPRTAPARRVIGDLVGLCVHQLYVVDEAGVLVGVITALDVLRHMAP